MRLTKLGDWDIDDDGNMSRIGQSEFQVYSAEDNLIMGQYMTYKLVDGQFFGTLHDTLEEQYATA